MNVILTIFNWLFHSYEEFCELNLTYFKLFGLFQMVNPYNRVSNRSQQIWLFAHGFFIVFTSAHTFLQIVSLFVASHSYQQLMNTFTHVGNWFIASYKYLNFVRSRHRLQALFDVFRMDFLHVSKFKDRKDILFDNAYRCNWFILLYVSICLSTCVVWNLYPLAELIYYSVVMHSKFMTSLDVDGNATGIASTTIYRPKNILDSWYPFDSSTGTLFYCVYVYEFFIYMHMLFAFCCYDSYLFSMFTMMTAQFQVLYDSFSDIGYDKPIRGYNPHLDALSLFKPEQTLHLIREKLFKSIKSECRLDHLKLLRSEQLIVDSTKPEKFKYMRGHEETEKAQEFHDSLLESVEDLQKANNYANELIEVYNDVIVFQVLISIITVCLMAFQATVYFSVVDDDEFTGTFQISKSLLYFGCAFLLLYLSCLCSGDLNDVRKSINGAFYNAHWHEFKLPDALKRDILFSMTCSQRTHVVEITHRFPIDLHTFTEISEVCFSYFTFLLNYYKKKGVSN
uniref:Odorant receptor 17 n=1 Tax=Drosicha corpulenta TaxID=535978 RepID=A0A0U3U161_9HEMI|nr:odorant receptor 17 [Drosicha corpulenta]